MTETAVPQRLLDAALEAATIHGIAKLSMGDVARRAELSRQTLYRHFPSKDALVAAVVTSETTHLIEQVVAAAVEETEPRAALEAGLLAALTVLRDHPLLDRLVRTEPEALLPLLTTDSSPVMVQVRNVVEAILAQGSPDLTHDAVALRRFADVVTRLLISYAVSAPDDPPEVVAHYLSTFLVHGAVASGAHLEATT
ncbi:MAG: TetR/AcrR family transcriptional regulator [Actinomycetes bacterium]